jgi:hypothetical protein
MAVSSKPVEKKNAPKLEYLLNSLMVKSIYQQASIVVATSGTILKVFLF